MTMKWSPDYNPPAQGHLIYTIDTTTGGATPSNVDFNLRSIGTVDYRVVWETSVEETSTSNTLLHTYGSAGTYDVQVFPTGTYQPFFSNVTADVDQIIKVSVGGGVDLGTNLANAWLGANNMTEFECNFSATSSVTSFNYTWRDCVNLTTFPLIDTSSGTDFTIAWYNCNSLTSFPQIDTSSGTIFTNTWRNCTSLTSFPLIDISSGTNFSRAWQACISLTSFPANFFDSWTGTPANNCFVSTWLNCFSLTATSVENILNSIDTSGQSAPASGVDITIDYDAASGTPNITTAVSNLKSRGWTITLNGVAQ